MMASAERRKKIRNHLNHSHFYYEIIISFRGGQNPFYSHLFACFSYHLEHATVTNQHKQFLSINCLLPWSTNGLNAGWSLIFFALTRLTVIDGKNMEMPRFLLLPAG